MKNKKTKKQKVKQKEAAKTVQPELRVDEKEKPFDFGGLPDRDLKKNLGCG